MPMRAVATVPGSNKVWLTDLAPPEELKPTQVLIRPKIVGVCATDREVVAGHIGAVPEGDEKLVLGHELFGEVEAVGDAVQDLKPGDLVCATVRRGCGKCATCQKSESDMCTTGDYFERGIYRAHGYLTEKIAEDAANVVKAPDEIAEIAVLTEPTSIGCKVMEHLCLINQRIRHPCQHPEHRYPLDWLCDDQWGKDKRALVAGAGPIGTMMAFLLRLANVETFIFATRPKDSPKAKIAESCGAHYFSVKDKIPSQVAKEVGGFDIVVDTTGVAEVCAELIDCLGGSGVLALLGVPTGKATVDLQKLMMQLLARNQMLWGVVNSNRRHFTQSMQALARIKKSFGDAVLKVIGARYPFEQFEKPILNPDRDVVKSVVMID